MATVKPMEALVLEAEEVVDLAAVVAQAEVPGMVEVLEEDAQEVAEEEVEAEVVVALGVELVEALEEISENNQEIRYANPAGIPTT